MELTETVDVKFFPSAREPEFDHALTDYKFHFHHFLNGHRLIFVFQPSENFQLNPIKLESNAEK